VNAPQDDGAPERLVFVVDDDDGVRTALVRLLDAEGHRVMQFASAAPFLEHPLPDLPCCLILDMEMPNLGGFQVVEAMTRRGSVIPVIFVTGYGSIPLTVRAMKAGALEFLTKPVAPDELLAAVASALAADEANLQARRELAAFRQGHNSLTPREREVFELLIGGLLNKQVAEALGVSEITAKVHKQKVMKKMRARSLADLARMAERLQIARSRSR
jgi:FixJ family two-component response regulator